MPVVTRSHSRRSKKKQEEPVSAEGVEQPNERKTPRRSARIAAQKQRSQSRELSQEGSMTPQQVSDPTRKPFFSGMTLGHDTLEQPIQLYVPQHEPESAHSIRQSIRQFTESPVTLKQAKIAQRISFSNNNSNDNNQRRLSNFSDNLDNCDSKDSSDNEYDTNDINITDYDDNDNSIDSDNNDNNDSNSNSNNNSDNSTNNSDDTNQKPLNSSLLSPNRNMQLTSQPGRVPTFNQNSQSWSFAPEEEMPTVARNLLIFIVGLILVVLAVIYQNELFAAYDTYMPSSFSDAYSTITEFLLGIYTYFYDFVTNLFASSDDTSSTVTTDTATDAAAADVAADATADAAAENVTE